MFICDVTNQGSRFSSRFIYFEPLASSDTRHLGNDVCQFYCGCRPQDGVYMENHQRVRIREMTSHRMLPSVTTYFPSRSKLIHCPRNEQFNKHIQCYLLKLTELVVSSLDQTHYIHLFRSDILDTFKNGRLNM